MEILEVSSQIYRGIIPNPYHVFASAEFSAMNESKADNVFYLLFKDSKYRMGIIVGARNNVLLSPFSAPFGGFVNLKSDIKISQIEDSVEIFLDWAKKKKFESVKITLPPSFYNESFTTKQTNVLFRYGFTIATIDINYSFQTKNLNPEYAENIWRNARKNLKIALENGFSLKICTDQSEKEIAYGIIKENRDSKSFPLRMSWDQVSETIKVINADFFLVQYQQKSIAAAIVFQVSKNVNQVVYWGDLPEFAHLKTMNFLSYKLFEHYKNITVEILDIGPSTENSVPNQGLCEFKESIGCDITQKVSFSLKMQCL